MRGKRLDDNDKIDSFDDLFEPFDLEDAPPPEEEPGAVPEPVIEDAPTVACPSCGSANPAHNRHCEYCGARISQGPLPVAPPPLMRTTAGARALMVLAGVILVVALIALLVNLFSSGDDSESATPIPGEDSAPTTEFPRERIEELQVADVTASSELPGFPASALIDADPLNSWNDTQESGTPQLVFTFAQPVQITQIIMQNVTDEARFKRNYRIETYEIEIDDLATRTTGTLADTNEPQTITVASVNTSLLTLTVLSTYPAEAFDGQIPFRELALQEVKFFGRLAESETATG